jgi:hypothetical protein
MRLIVRATSSTHTSASPWCFVRAHALFQLGLGMALLGVNEVVHLHLGAQLGDGPGHDDVGLVHARLDPVPDLPIVHYVYKNFQHLDDN